MGWRKDGTIKVCGDISRDNINMWGAFMIESEGFVTYVQSNVIGIKDNPV
jgi:hypothetical protein